VLAALWLSGMAGAFFLMGDTPIAGRDFASMWLAGRAIRADINVYDLEALRAFGHQLLHANTHFNYTYPPHALFLAVPVSVLPITISFIVWNLLSAALFFWAARPFVPRGMSPVLSILTPAALVNCIFGQYGLLTGSLWLLAFRGSGLAAGALTFKPHMGFLVLPALWRNKKTLSIAIWSAVGLVLTSAIVFGHWPDFIRHVTMVQGGKLIGRSESVWVLTGTTPMFGYGMLGWLVFAASGAWLLARNYNVFTAATATFLISPYGFHYDTTVVCLGFGILIFTKWNDMTFGARVICWLAFLTPEIVSLGTWWVPPILLAGLHVQTRFKFDPSDGAVQSAPSECGAELVNRDR